MTAARPAVLNDWARLFAWRNDPATIATSISGRAVTLAEHWKWFKRVLGSDISTIGGTSLYVVVQEPTGHPIGTYRLDRAAKRRVEVSLTVCPLARGKRHAVAFVRLAILSAYQTIPSMHLVAIVSELNVASLRAFASNGFVPSQRGDVVEMVKTDTGRMFAILERKL